MNAFSSTHTHTRPHRRTDALVVALGLLAEYLVHHHEGLEPSREWQQHGEDCMASLDVSHDELNHWIDELYPAFEAVRL